MEKNQNEKFAEAIKEFRGTIFEYSSSSSDEEENNKNSKFNLLKFKKNKAKSSMNLPIKWKKFKNQQKCRIFIKICPYDSIFSSSYF